MCALEKQHRIKPYINSILKWGYLSIVNKCKKNNVIPIWVYIPALGDSDDSTYDEVLQLANKCGFITIEIKSPYNTFNKDELMIAPWDFHLNKKGHQLIANNLTKELISHKKELKLD